MKLATLRTNTGTTAVLVTGDEAVEIDGVPDVGVLLTRESWMSLAAAASGSRHPLSSIDPSRWAPVIPAPGKILCAGLNYRKHILEMGRDLPEYPTFFAKYPESLIGASDDIELAAVSDAVDWEGELAVVIGKPARRLTADAAANVIAGYAVFNDVTMRDYQYRTLQWLQGKTFEHTSPFGPYLVTPDEWTPGPNLITRVDGETVQEASTGDLVFDPAALIAYASEILTLNPGDVIATGTPGGVGHAHTPPRYLTAGAVLETSIHGLGTQHNRAAPPT
ncbi:MAG: fumarylacetoacetate hydrolase family protein [Microbacteriaceae bacterium]